MNPLKFDTIKRRNLLTGGSIKSTVFGQSNQSHQTALNQDGLKLTDQRQLPSFAP